MAGRSASKARPRRNPPPALLRWPGRTWPRRRRHRRNPPHALLRWPAGPPRRRRPRRNPLRALLRWPAGPPRRRRPRRNPPHGLLRWPAGRLEGAGLSGTRPPALEMAGRSASKAPASAEPAPHPLEMTLWAGFGRTRVRPGISRQSQALPSAQYSVILRVACSGGCPEPRPLCRGCRRTGQDMGDELLLESVASVYRTPLATMASISPSSCSLSGIRRVPSR